VGGSSAYWVFIYHTFLSPLSNTPDVMLKLKSYFLLAGIVLGVLTACKEDDPEPLKAETQAILLAGQKGSSKSWKLTAASFQEGTSASTDIALDACILDNIYLFSNNDDQSYKATEGATSCDPADPNVVEAGNWTFTLDGEILIVLPDEVTYSNSALFSFLTYPSEIVTLTDSGMTLKMNIVETGSPYSYTLTFVKI
jgi:hypothetical protein